MRMKASVNKMFKKNIKYANTHNQYMYIQAHVSINGDTIRQTFYLNPDLTQIVSFKNN